MTIALINEKFYWLMLERRECHYLGVCSLTPFALTSLPTSYQISADVEQRAKEIKKLREKLQQQTNKYKSKHD